MRSKYTTPTLSMAELEPSYSVNVTSIDGGDTGIGYGGGADPSTGRAKDRDIYYEDTPENSNSLMYLW